MKVIARDNFDRDTVNDWLVCDNVKNDHVGRVIINALNDTGNNHSAWYYDLVPDDYILKVWEP